MRCQSMESANEQPIRKLIKKEFDLGPSVTKQHRKKHQKQMKNETEKRPTAPTIECNEQNAVFWPKRFKI